MEVLPSIPYDGDEDSGDNASLFALWEKGHAAPLPAPLSVRRPRYRRFIVALVKHYLQRSAGKILSIGSGNGFTEVELSEAGFDVLATDKSRIALEYCKAKGLATAYLNFPRELPAGLPSFDLIYCDGLFGHLWQPDASYRHSWRGLAAVGAKRAMVLLSNDLANTDATAVLHVTGNPQARFFRPPAGWFAQDAEDTGLWTLTGVHILRYRRRHHQRRREIVLLRRSLMYER